MPNNNTEQVPDPIHVLTDLVARLSTIEENRQSGIQRPKAINCRLFKCGQEWTSYSPYFVENVRAAYSFVLPRDQEKLDAACLNWLPSKLEQGATLSVYENLDDLTKTSWSDVNDALREAFADDAERELFVNDVTQFRRGEKTLIEYKNDLLKKMNTHFKPLKRVPSEFQRQATARFIEGLDDEKLKNKLRRHCKRERNTIEEAFQYAIDWESSQVMASVHEKGNASSNGIVFAAVANPVTVSSSDPEVRQMRVQISKLAAKQEKRDQQLDQLLATHDQMQEDLTAVNERVDEVSERLSRLTTTVKEGFDEVWWLMSDMFLGE